MGGNCKGVCVSNHGGHPSVAGGGGGLRYATGGVRCSVCQVWFRDGQVDGKPVIIHCPCCRNKVRYCAHSNKHRHVPRVA